MPRALPVRMTPLRILRSRPFLPSKPGSALTEGKLARPPHPAPLAARCLSPQTEWGAIPLWWSRTTPPAPFSEEGVGGMRSPAQTSPPPRRSRVFHRGSAEAARGDSRAGVRPRAATLALAVVLWSALLVALAGCGNPQQSATVGTIAQVSAPVPSGPHLYCITNVGHTLVAYSLALQQVLPETARYLDLDPVGPWFAGGAGYYLSRVETSGAGSNALIRFDPRTAVETGRLTYPANSNPNSLLLLPAPHGGTAWVALRGSTFDNFATNGVSVVNLATLTDPAFCDLNADTATCPRLVPDQGSAQTSLLGFRWDAACDSGNGCAYAIVNNFNGGVRNGRLLRLQPDAQGRPVLLDSVALGRNPMQDTVLDGDGELWVVNNGGYVHYGAGGQPGTLQVLDTNSAAALAADPDGDGLPGTTVAIATPATCAALPRPDPGCDPTGIYWDGASASAWVTTYPDDVLRTAALAGNALQPLDSALPRVTGPFFPTAAPAPALYAGLGGLGLARLGRLDAATTALLGDQSLQAGQAPLSCTEFQVP